EARDACYHDPDIDNPRRNEPEQIFCIADDGVCPPIQIDEDESGTGNDRKGTGKGGEERFALRTEVGREANDHPSQQKVQGIFGKVIHFGSSSDSLKRIHRFPLQQFTLTGIPWVFISSNSMMPSPVCSGCDS